MSKPRTHRPIPSLTVSAPRREELAPGHVVRTLPWFVAAVLGAGAAVAVGWLAVAVVVSAAWLTASRLPLVSLLDVIGQGWLASHGARVHLGALDVALMPLGLTALAVAGVAAATHWAGLQMALDEPRWRDLAALVGTSAGSYALAALVLASLVGAPSQATAVVGGALVIGVLGAAVGGFSSLGLDREVRLPGWARRLPRAIGVGLVWLAGGSTLALVVGLVQRWEQVQSLHRGLAPDSVGAVLLVLLYVAYLPSMLLWAGSYVLGAGITVGTGTMVVPGSSSLGLLPAFPPFAALPPGGTPLDWAWLVVGVAAGVASGVWFCRGEHAAGAPASWARWSWQSALAGLGTAAVWLALSWLSRGDLGTGRLVGMGPVFPALLWFALVPLVVGAGVGGTVVALLLARNAPVASDTSLGEDTEPMPMAAAPAGPGE